MPTTQQKANFLENDFYDAVRWLFVGAVTWHAAGVQQERCPHQRLLGKNKNCIAPSELVETVSKANRGQRLTQKRA